MSWFREEKKTERRSISTGNRIDFHQYRNRRKAGFSGLLRMLVYGAMVLALAFMLMELVQMVPG